MNSINVHKSVYAAHTQCYQVGREIFLRIIWLMYDMPWSPNRRSITYTYYQTLRSKVKSTSVHPRDMYRKGNKASNFASAILIDNKIHAAALEPVAKKDQYSARTPLETHVQIEQYMQLINQIQLWKMKGGAKILMIWEKYVKNGGRKIFENICQRQLSVSVQYRVRIYLNGNSHFNYLNPGLLRFQTSLSIRACGDFKWFRNLTGQNRFL